MLNTETMRPRGPIVIDIENITKHYIMGEETVHALRGVTLQIHRNEYLAIMGPSGSGKSTLMNMLGCLDTPSSGRYEFNGKNVSEMDDDELATIVFVTTDNKAFFAQTGFYSVFMYGDLIGVVLRKSEWLERCE